MRKFLFSCLVFFNSLAIHAKDLTPLPQPLSLSQALALVDQSLPEQIKASQHIQQQAAQLQLTQSQFGIQVAAQAVLRWLEPAESLRHLGHQDHTIKLIASKPLYDFGRQQNREAAAQQQLVAAELKQKYQLQQHRLAVMEAFFNVLVADLTYARDNEDMATAFVSYDRIKDRAELGERSDIDLLKAFNEYQAVRQQRFASEAQQRSTRARLASLLNRPNNLPAILLVPETSLAQKKPPPFEQLLQTVFANNVELSQLQATVDAAKHHWVAAQRHYWPRLELQTETGVYSRGIGSNDVWRAGVSIEAPLYSAGQFQAKAQQAQAHFRQAEQDIVLYKRQLQQRLLELWLNLDVLQKQWDEAQALFDFRELYLDRARALYDMEVKTDLGDAMVQLTQAQLQQAKVQYAIILHWAELEVMGALPAGEVLK
ncbi:MAG: TolC family protein [Gammaproteobacteria bacterium]|nr:TolC family protein [Gammaproteobacteria bacterium]